MAAVSLADFLSKVKNIKGLQTNPHVQFEKLLKSHRYTDTSRDATEIFFYMLNDPDDFFKAENMPSDWSIRTYSSSMENMMFIVQNEEIKQILTAAMADDYDKLVDIIIARKKKYMNESKKEARIKKKPEKDNGVQQPRSLAPLNTSPETPYELDTPTHDTSPETPHELDTSLEQPQEPFKEQSLNFAKHHVSNAIWILEKYYESETDDFKQIILDLVLTELRSIK